MIFSPLTIHNHDRMSSITRVPHTTTWHYFTSRLPYRFSRSLEVVKEAIMTDINNVLQEFWRTSSDAEPSFFAMRRLLDILQSCFDILDVCFDIISVFATATDFADKTLQNTFFQQDYLNTAKIKTLLDGYRELLDQSFLKSKDLGVVLRSLPGVVVQKPMNMQGMADLYGIEPDSLGRLAAWPIEKASEIRGETCYVLDRYLSDFLQDRDRSQHYYCDPRLQHHSICLRFLSLLDEFNLNALDLRL